MINSAQQLGAFAIRPSTSGTPDVATAKFRQANIRLYTTFSALSGIAGGWIASTRVASRPMIELGINTAGSTTSSSGPAEEPNALCEKFGWWRESLSSFDVGPVKSIDVFDRYCYSAGSFARRTEIQYAAPEFDALHIVRAAKARAVEYLPAVSPPPPYVSVIWSLVEAQQLRKARALLKLIPDAPEYARLKKLLSMPASSASERKDFDRSAEYKWLAENAKNYAGKWVAVSGDSLLAAADTLKGLRQEVRTLAPARTPLLHYVE